MAISPKMVQELRETTGVGMMECKRALEEANGDKDEAIKILRKKGIATAAKKSNRAASDGIVVAHIDADGRAGFLLEVNCETDFVTKTDDFKELVKALTERAAQTRAADADALLAMPGLEPGQTVKDSLVAKIAKIGENLQARRLSRLEGQGNLVTSYIHAGGKIGVLLEAQASLLDDAAHTVAKDLCMQVAASQPRFVRREEVTPEILDGEKEIYRAQVAAQGKPANIVDKIVEGKMNKYYEENCLLEQPFIKDPGQTVQAYIKATSPGLDVKRFLRFLLGEGVVKASE
jgi:elongation factor Ts